jgi:integrase/recombinase XerD
MTSIAPHMTAFFHQRLPHECGASAHTCDSYADTFRLLLNFASQRLHTSPSALSLEQIDAPLVLAFLTHIETQRGNCANTRNTRLAAIKSFMHYVQYQVPDALEQVRQILAIPTKRSDQPLVGYLSREEIQALLDAPDPGTPDGIRDRAMFHLAFASGLRVSELIGLPISALSFQPTPCITVNGKGHKQRILPLWNQTVSALRAWLAVRGTPPVPELFVNARREPLTRWGFDYILRKHVKSAATRCPSLGNKRISPHTLRHYLPFLTMSC